MIRSSSRLLALMVALLPLLSGCYLHRDAASLRVTIAVPALPDTLDPHVIDDPATRYVHAAVFDAVTTVDEHGEVQPALATEWRPLGPTAWEFKIRQNVRFQNGEELNAHTVVFNVRRVLRPDLHSPVLKDIPTLVRANTRDLHTVVVTTRRPDPILPRRLAALYIAPIEYLQRVGDTAFGAQPSGTGPWIGAVCARREPHAGSTQGRLARGPAEPYYRPAAGARPRCSGRGVSDRPS